MKKKGKRHLKPEVKGILVFVLVLIALLTAYAVYHEITAFTYEEDLERTIVSIGDTTINLKEISYYIMQVENDGNQYALLYNPQNPAEYWGIYMNEETQSGYVSNLAREAALNYCIRDNVYYLEAQNIHMELTKEEQEEVKGNAENYYFLMSERQRTVTQLLPEDLELILTKVMIAQKYMLWMASQEEEASALEMVTLHYDVGGDYYEELLSSYEIRVNKRIWEQVHPGFVTIN